MPLLLRKIKQGRWLIDPSWNTWLQPDELHGDPLGDLATTAGELSVWHVEDDKSNLNQVITGLAVGVDKIDKFDYALFDESLLSWLKIKMEPKEAPSAVREARVWHRHLIQLSALKLVELAKAIMAHAEIDRREKDDVRELVINGLLSGTLDRTQIKFKEKELLALDKLVAERESKSQGT